MPKGRRRNVEEVLAAYSPEPRTTASSGSVKCRLSCRPPSASVRDSCSLGTRTPPPTISMLATSVAVRLLRSRMVSSGTAARWKKSPAICSNASRVMELEKSMPMCISSEWMGAALLALSTSLVFLTARRSLDMTLGWPRTSWPCFSWNSAAKCSMSSASSEEPPRVLSHATSSTSNCWNLRALFTLENLARLTSTLPAPMS
mmetsp:Transcript_18257/g.46769  ORF Transcript_18257/g.46769 Transcript_18257/m.46769 type:complete len:202 (+) Transcript_18257:550-1155(+)